MVERAEAVNPKKAIPEKKNKSCSFILPLLGKRRDYFEGLINCYLGDEVNKPLDSLTKLFVHMEQYSDSYTKIDSFDQFYKLDDDTYMLVYNIPSKLQDDYIRFYKGEYSKMSEDAKELICKFSSQRPVMNSIVYKVLYKTADQKEAVEKLIGQKLPMDAEVYSIPDLDREVYIGHKIKRSNNITKDEVKEIL